MSDAKQKDDIESKSDGEGLSPKDKADLYVALGQSAQQRFNTHHGVEWKIHFGLWTFLVVGAVLLTRDFPDWKPTPLECVFLNLLTVVLLVVYWCCWLPHSHEYREECTRSRWWWEACAWDALMPHQKRKLPKELRPDGWRVPFDENWNNWGARGWIHPSQWMASIVTLFFVLLFLGALWTRFDKWTDYPEGLVMAWVAGIVGGLLGGVAISVVFYGRQYKRWERKVKECQEDLQHCQRKIEECRGEIQKCLGETEESQSADS